ncbi:MAG: porphobilinogen synthase [Pseudomonadota bacterium]
MAIYGAYPHTRMRRKRTNETIRLLIRETHLTPHDFILPLFICAGKNQIQPLDTLPGVYRYSVDEIVKQAKLAQQAGLNAIGLFPHTPDHMRNAQASEALNPDNLVCQATRAVREALPDMIIVCDVALDPYTSHGHDGLIKNGQIDNEQTNIILAKQALIQAKAGCDTLAPSDMMDGRIGIIRKALDEAGYTQTRLLSYAVKYASQFYGPFREAVGSKTKQPIDKRTYQMDPANLREGIAEAALDIAEGADMLMVKPALGYLDVLTTLKQKFEIPIFAYQVSGEYAMLAFGAKAGAFDFNAAMIESLLSIKRAGADAIFSYYALEAIRKLNL